jgi:hypothetical protein
MPNSECNGVQNTSTGLWIIAVNSDGTFSWGNPEDAVCFTEEQQASIVTDLGEGYAAGRPKRRLPN